MKQKISLTAFILLGIFLIYGIFHPEQINPEWLYVGLVLYVFSLWATLHYNLEGE